MPDATQENAADPSVPKPRDVRVVSVYVAACLAVGLALVCTALIVPLGEGAPLFLFLAAVVVSAWYGGPGPGLFATALAIAGHWLLAQAPYLDDLVRTVCFGLVGGVISALAAGRRRAEDRQREREQVQILARERAAGAALSAVGHALVQSLDSGRAGHHIAEGVRALLGGTLSVLWELDPVSRRLVVVATSGPGGAFAPGTRIPQNEAVAGFAVTEGRPVSSADIRRDPRITLTAETRARVEQSGHGAVLAVPLIIGGRVTGVLAVGDVTGRTFHAEEIRRLQDFANQAAIALEHARLFALETARREHLEALAAVQRDLSAELDLDRLLTLIVERMGRLFAGFGFAYLFDEESQTLGPRVWGRAEPEAEAPFPADGGLVASCAASRAALLANEYAASPYALPAVVSIGVRHAMAQPLVSRDRLLGVLVMCRRGDPPFRPEDLATFGGLAGQAAVALDNAILFVDAGRQRREAEVLADLARSINIAQDVSTVLQRVVDGAKELCGCDLTRVALREGESGAVVMRNRAGDYRQESGRRLVIERGRGAGGLVLESGRPFRSDNLPEDPRITRDYAHLVALEGLVTTLVVPIMLEGRVEGLLYVHRRTPRPFTDRTEVVLGQLAQYAAIAIHNMRMLEHEHRMRAEAEGASRMKDEFLATLSHELRSPLQPLLNWAYLLRSPNLDPASAERAIDAIERSTKTLGQLIEDLLDVSRIVTGKLRLQARPVRLPAVVRGALEAVEAAALAKSVTLESRIEPDLPAVLGDPDRLQQVLWNLLSNGIKFTPRGGRVTVSVAGRNSEVLLTVADTGAGIKPEFLPHVFERFRQADSSTNRTYGGLGLGLAIVRHLVELHGGSVVVQSEGEGQGATFSVRLPVAAVARPAERAPATVQGPAPVGQGLAGLKLLVVDDEADAREVMRFMLERGGAAVRTADSAAQALDAIREERPDLVISDIGMPVEDGYVLVRRLRAMEEGLARRLPAIALTAYASEEDTRRALGAGFDAHLSKPVDPTRLIEVAAGLAGARRGPG